MKQQKGFEHGHCLKCGSSLALVNETVVHLEVDGEIVKTYSGTLKNRNCVRCSYPEVYPDFAEHERSGRPEGDRAAGIERHV